MSPVRPSRRTLIIYLILLALLWAGVAAALRASATARPATPVRSEYSARLGVNLSLSELTPPRHKSTMDRLEALGIQWVRFTIPWDAVQPERGRFEWALWDAVFSAFAEHPAMRPVVVLDRSPLWARGALDAANPLAPPHERSDFGAFALAVAQRYGQQVDHYQVWHEPNIAPHWGTKAPDPDDYVGLLREAAINLRAADGDATIVLAALAPTTESGGANLSDLAFLDGVYAVGGGAWFDVVAGQPYGFSAAPSESAAPDRLNFARITLLHDLMDRRGDGDRPLWATAWGWSAEAPGSAPSPWAGVDASQQADYAAQALASAAVEYPWLGPLFWPAFCPDDPAGEIWLGFALCGPGSAGTPLWDAISAHVKPPAVLAAGQHTMADPALSYGAGWRNTASAADPPKTAEVETDGASTELAAGAPLSFTFSGTGLALRVQGGDYWAYLRVSVDGAAANALPRDENGFASLVLYDPLAAERTVTLAQGLAPSQHTVTITPFGGWGQWPLRGILVDGAGAAQQTREWLLAAVAALISALGAFLLFAPSGTRFAAGLSRSIRTFSTRIMTLLDRFAGASATLLLGLGGLAAVALYFSRSTALDFALLAAMSLLMLASPSVALPLIAASLPFWQQPKPVLRWEFGLFEIFAWMGLAALTARAGLDHVAGRSARDFRLTCPLDLVILVLFASGTVSSIFAAEQGVAWREWRIVFLFGIVVYGLVRFLVLAGSDAGSRFASWRRGRVEHVTGGLLAGAAIVSIIGLYQFITGNGRVDVEGVLRIRALYGSPNNLALLLDRAAPLALALAAVGGGRRRAALAAVAALIFVACVVTFSKGALLLGLPFGLAFVLLGGAWRGRRRWPLWLLAALIVLGLIGLAVLFRTPRFADLFNFETGTSFFRLKLWQGAINMGRDHPLFGVGPDNFLYAYRTRYVLPSAWQELNLSHPHNLLLDLWTRLGLIGVAAGLTALFAGFRTGWRLFRSASVEVWPLALGLLAGLLVTVTHGMIDNSLFLPDLMGWFAISAALFATLTEAAPVEQAVRS